MCKKVVYPLEGPIYPYGISGHFPYVSEDHRGSHNLFWSYRHILLTNGLWKYLSSMSMFVITLGVFDYVLHHIKVWIPFSPFDEGVLNALQVTLSHLHPTWCRHLVAFVRVCECYEVKAQIDTFFHILHLKGNMQKEMYQRGILSFHQPQKLFDPFKESVMNFKYQYMIIQPKTDVVQKFICTHKRVPVEEIMLVVRWRTQSVAILNLCINGPMNHSWTIRGPLCLSGASFLPQWDFIEKKVPHVDIEKKIGKPKSKKKLVHT